MAKTDKCLNPNCKRKARTRGLCGTCYVTAYNLVKKGRTTWAKLEASGKARPPVNRGGKVTTWLLEK